MIIFHNTTVFTVSDKINVSLVSIRVENNSVYTVFIQKKKLIALQKSAILLIITYQ